MTKEQIENKYKVKIAKGYYIGANGKIKYMYKLFTYDEDQWGEYKTLKELEKECRQMKEVFEKFYEIDLLLKGVTV